MRWHFGAPRFPYDTFYRMRHQMVFKLHTSLATILLSGFLGVVSTSSVTAQIFDDQVQGQDIGDQDIDVFQELIDALQRAPTTGPVFRLSPDRVLINMTAGETSSSSVTVLNQGDEPGLINGINVLGNFEGLTVGNTCPVGSTLPNGDFCEITVSYESQESFNSRTIESVIVLTFQERDRSSTDIPVTINVQGLPMPEPEPAEPVRPEPEPTPPPIVIPEAPRGPTPQDIANMYFNNLRGMQTPAIPERGFTRVSLPENLRPQDDVQFLGLSPNKISRDRITEDPRYDENIPWTEASLPVNRDMIITSDRVIKAVLETPLSNVMCDSVVAIVESDVYSATSLRPLIPAGSRVLGQCGRLLQERAGIAWNRIITTDGRSITLAGNDLMTRDASGLGGALGRVYRTPFDRFVMPILSTFVDVGAGLFQAEFGENTDVVIDESGRIVETRSARNEGVDIITNAVRDTNRQLLRELQDVREVMIVPAGTRIDIEISEDIYFKSDREVIRLADTLYDVPRMGVPTADTRSPENIVLRPYRPGLTGPVVTVNGQRFVLEELGGTRFQGVQNGQTMTTQPNGQTDGANGVATNGSARPAQTSVVDDLRR